MSFFGLLKCALGFLLFGLYSTALNPFEWFGNGLVTVIVIAVSLVPESKR
jgi:hypothetical protein